METVDQWRRRKRTEIDRLASRLTDPPALGDLPDADAVTAAKLVLRARIAAARMASGPDVVETNRFDAEGCTIDPYLLRWRYQRFDLAVHSPEVYPTVIADRPSVFATRFASSGMGAIAPLLLAFQQRGERPALVIHHDAYFETIEILNTMTFRLASNVVPSGSDLAKAAREARAGGNDFVVVWIDSYVVDDPLATIADLKPEDADYVVVDTTCYEVSDPRIRALADRALEAGSPVALVRSHLKLDGLGVEYGRLGSVVHLATPFLPPERFEAFRELKGSDIVAGRLVGASAVPAHLNPFLGDAEYHALNKDRVARIVAANERAGKALRDGFAGTHVTVRTFHHGLFIAVGPWKRDIHPLELGTALGVLVGQFRAQGHAVRMANSFGFDFCAVAPFRGPESGLPEVRFAIGDWPDAWVDALVDAILAEFRQPTWALL